MPEMIDGKSVRFIVFYTNKDRSFGVTMKHNNPDKKQYIFGGQLFPSAKGAEILVEIFGVGEIKIRTWLCRIGMWAKKLHERFILESEDCDHTFNVYIL